MQRVVILLFLLVPLGLLSGCASTPTRVEPGTRLDIPEQGPEPGPLEEQLRSYVEDLIEILDAPTDDPDATVRAIGRYLEENRRAIIETAQEVAERVAAMPFADQIYYEERFVEFFTPTTLRWAESLDRFRQQYPDAAPRIDGLMLFFD